MAETGVISRTSKAKRGVQGRIEDQPGGEGGRRILNVILNVSRDSANGNFPVLCTRLHGMKCTLGRARRPRLSFHPLAESRYFSSTKFRYSQDKDIQKAYSATLRLPKTKFKLWSDPVQREAATRNRTTEGLYAWQVIEHPCCHIFSITLNI